MFRKCYRHGINMTAVLQASRASRNALYQNAPYDRFVTHLNHIQESSTRRIYPEWMVILAIGLASSAFCLIFGGHAVEALYTMLAAMAGALVRYLCSRVEFNVYVTIAASAFAATVTAYFTMYLPGAISPFLPIVACALTLIPGVPLINAVDDFLNNYLTSGMTRITHTLLIMLAMTFGIAGAVGITDVPSFTDVNIAPESLYLTQALAAAMAALGFPSCSMCPDATSPPPVWEPLLRWTCGTYAWCSFTPAWPVPPSSAPPCCLCSISVFPNISTLPYS